MYVSIQELRGKKQAFLRLMILLAAYRHAVHAFDPENRVPMENEIKQYADLIATLMFQWTNILIYVCCFPPNLLSRCMCVAVTLF